MRIRRSAIFRIDKYSIHFAFKIDWIYYVVIHIFIVIHIFFACYKEYIVWQISFSEFSDLLPAFASASGISNHRSICLGLKIWVVKLSVKNVKIT